MQTLYFLNLSFGSLIMILYTFRGLVLTRHSSLVTRHSSLTHSLTHSRENPQSLITTIKAQPAKEKSAQNILLVKFNSFR